MHVQVKLVLEEVETHCEYCKTFTFCVRANLFTKTAIAESKLVCLLCIKKNGGLEETLELEEPDVEVNRKKTLKRQKKASRDQEIDIAEELGAKVQVNSGATVGSKGDVRKKGVVRVEAKFTSFSSYSLKLEELHKISGECEGKEKPVMVVDFQEPRTHRTLDRYAIVPFEDFKEMFDAHNNR
jgi:hypothetical protein